MKNTSNRFVEKLYNMSRERFPLDVEAKARECFLDYLSVGYGGCRVHEEKNNVFLRTNKLAGDTHVFGSDQMTDLHSAVMINAFNAHVLELDDSHRVAMTHLGAPIFSALLGVAEVYGKSIGELLHAAVIGYEAAICLANAIQPSHKKRGFHVSGTCCTVGCAMGIAAMLNYSLQEMENVFSAAATSAAGLLAVVSGKSEQKPYNIANAAVTGVDAAIYGKYFRGAVDILEDSRGFFRALSDEYHIERLFDSGYAIKTIYQKLYAACRHCHAPMEAILTIQKTNGFNPDNVESITVETYELAINGHDHKEISGYSSAKQSIPYGAAVASVYQNCGISAFEQDKLSDERVLNLAKKVTVHENTELTRICPGKRAAIVTVNLNTGETRSCRVDYAKGEPENPITKQEFECKFLELTSAMGMDIDTAQHIINFVNTADNELASELYQWMYK